MLRNRSRAVTSNQARMADQGSLLKTPSSPISSFLASPRFFNGFLFKNPSDAETAVISPTSILDTNNSSVFVNPFGYDRNLSKFSSEQSNPTNNQEPQAIGLALIDSIVAEKGDEFDGNFSKPINRMVLLGSKLKVQIPAANPPQSMLSPVESPKSPADFGIKTRISQFVSPLSSTSSKDLTRKLSLKEMELSEDYTCVITHGPNPKTTHIFDEYIVVESCNVGGPKFSEANKIEYDSEAKPSNSLSPNFLSFCHNCRGILRQDKDIYIYRGEKAFCSDECRSQEMLFEGMKHPGVMMLSRKLPQKRSILDH